MVWFLFGAIAGWPACYGMGWWFNHLAERAATETLISTAVNEAILAERDRARRMSHPDRKHAPSLPGSGPGAPQPTQRAPRHGAQTRPRARTTAADLGPVFWASGCTEIPFIPQASGDKNGADQTGTLPRIKLETGTSGEMRALVDGVIARMRGEQVP